MLLNQTRSKGNFLGLTLFCKMKPDEIIIKKLKEWSRYILSIMVKITFSMILEQSLINKKDFYSFCQVSLQNRQERRMLLLNGGWDVQWPMFVQFHFLKECPFTSLKVALINVVSTNIVSIFQHVSILSLVSFVSSEWTIAFQLIYIHLNIRLN